MSAAVSRAFTNILSRDLARQKGFYTQLFDMKVAFESDWFVHLQSTQNPGLELGLLRQDHEIVPALVRSAPTGVLLTFVVEDVDALFEACQARGVEIVEGPRDLFYGQRRMLLRDPEGTWLDVSSEGTPDPDWLKTLG